MTETTLPAAPVTISPATVIHLPTDLALRVLDVDESYWEHASRAAELSDGRILSVFEYSDTWGWWERHPVGDELVMLLSGDVDLLLDDTTGERTVPLSPGQSAIIPTGAWHRAVVRAPSQLLFITPTPARTQHRDA